MMPNLSIAATVVLVFSPATFAQTDPPPNIGAGIGDPCTNGVLSMSLRAVQSPGPRRRPIDPEPVPIWEGLLQIRLKNVSTLIVHLVQRADQHELAVLDALGKPVLMTEFRKERLPRGTTQQQNSSI